METAGSLFNPEIEVAAMEKIKILQLDKIAEEGLKLFGDKFEIGRDLKDPDGILVRSSKVDVDDFPSLLAVARAGAGVNNITVNKATEKGVCVFNTPGANANAVAELVFVMLGTCARNIHLGTNFCQGLSGLSNTEISTQVETQKAQFRGFELAGKTLGVIGLGKIGVIVANGGITRGMKVIGFDPYPALENIHSLSSDVILARSMKQLLSLADIISIHVPLNDKTRGLINKKLLDQFLSGTILVNFARGPIVEEEAVLAALDNGHLSNYITDFPSKETICHPRIICSPHLGASTEESEEHCASMAARELIGYFEYGTISHSVNFPTAESIPSDNVHSRLTMINRDIPGMIGFASQIIGSHEINIGSYINESNGSIGYNIIDLETEIPSRVLAEIEKNSDVIRTRLIRLA